jgi:hypothetical protein
MEGKGKLTTTGKLGDVMQESAQAAMSYIRSGAPPWACRAISTAPGHSYSRPRRRDSEGRAVGGHHSGHHAGAAR